MGKILNPERFEQDRFHFDKTLEEAGRHVNRWEEPNLVRVAIKALAEGDLCNDEKAGIRSRLHEIGEKNLYYIKSVLTFKDYLNLMMPIDFMILRK